MTAVTTLAAGAWTKVLDPGFGRAIVEGLARSEGVWFELAAAQPSANTPDLGILYRPTEKFDVECADPTLALWARSQSDSGDGRVRAIVVGYRNDGAASSGHALQSSEVTFTETTGAGVYTGSVSIPAGATIHDIIVNGVALWDAASSATMIVGDETDDDGYYTAINLKATDLLAGESLSFALAGGKAGAYIANAQVSPRYAATPRVITGRVTTVGATGSAGRTRMTVVYSKPTTAFVSSATKA